MRQKGLDLQRSTYCTRSRACGCKGVPDRVADVTVKQTKKRAAITPAFDMLRTAETTGDQASASRDSLMSWTQQNKTNCLLFSKLSCRSRYLIPVPVPDYLFTRPGV